MLFLLCVMFSLTPAMIEAGIEEVNLHGMLQYCVIGAGPGGLQMGYFLQQAGRNYTIFEKEATAGAFYTKFPIHRKLISVNKRYTGKTNKEFNIRHDWNSLLSHDESLLFTKYSEDFFPPADVVVKYFQDFALKLHLNVKYGITISNIQKINSTFLMADQHGRSYECKYVIVATGMSKPNRPNFKGKEFVTGYESLSLDIEEYADNNVLILGHGNSAFEVAEHIMSSTRSIHMMARTPITMAWSTHYVGNLRAVNLAFANTALQNTLDAIIRGSVGEQSFSVTKSDLDGKLYLKEYGESERNLSATNHNNPWDGIGYDKVIGCLGFTFDESIFNETLKISRSKAAKKYPGISLAYESIDVENLYFVGANTHSLDFKKSAGAFIHGYRYTTRALHHLLEWKLHGNKWPYIHFDNLIDLASHLAKRFNEASDLYQMFGVLCDVAIYNWNKSEVVYLEAFPCALTSELSASTGHPVVGAVLVMSMEYGKDSHLSKQFMRKTDQAHQSYFLHPILYHYDKLFSSQAYQSRPQHWILPVPDHHLHIVEDFLTKFDDSVVHLLPLRRFIETTTARDIRVFFAEHCLMLSLTTREQPMECSHTVKAKPRQILALNYHLTEQLSRMKAYILPFQVVQS